MRDVLGEVLGALRALSPNRARAEGGSRRGRVRGRRETFLPLPAEPPAAMNRASRSSREGRSEASA